VLFGEKGADANRSDEVVATIRQTLGDLEPDSGTDAADA
jgi:hypothetical protein